MNLELNTYGRNPAAHYLVRLLNKHDDMKLNRSCSTRITHFNTNVAGIIASVDSRVLEPKIAANLLRILRVDAGTVELPPNFSMEYEDRELDFISNLVRNIIIGNIKSAIRRVTVIRKIENGNSTKSKMQRKARLSGESKGIKYFTILGYHAGSIQSTTRLMSSIENFIPHTPDISSVIDDVIPEVLHERSKLRCARRGVVFNTSGQGRVDLNPEQSTGSTKDVKFDFGAILKYYPI